MPVVVGSNHGLGSNMITGRDQAPLCAGSLRGLVRQLSIDQFENEGRRVMTDPSPGPGNGHSPMFERAGMTTYAVSCVLHVQRIFPRAHWQSCVCWLGETLRCMELRWKGGPVEVGLLSVWRVTI